jgi:hypothetical protein
MMSERERASSGLIIPLAEPNSQGVEIGLRICSNLLLDVEVLMAIMGKGPDASALLPAVSSLDGASERQHSGVLDKVDGRREARYPCNERAEVRVLFGETAPLPATVMDISRSGLRLVIPVALTKGLAIQVMLPKEVIVLGRVRYCRRTGESFHTGVYIDDVFYASQADGSGHIHDDDMALYLAKRGLSIAELLGVRDHIQRCKLCSTRYHDAPQSEGEPRAGSIRVKTAPQRGSGTSTAYFASVRTRAAGTTSLGGGRMAQSSKGSVAGGFLR